MSDSSSRTARVPRPPRKGAGGASLLALASLSVAIAVGWWIATEADLLGIRFDHAYYVLLVVLGLAAAAFLFGVLRSSATLTGNHLGVGFEVGGAAALFLLVVWGGAHFTTPPESFSAVVRLVHAGEADERRDFENALPDSLVIVRFGANTRRIHPNRDGEVEIRDIPGRFRSGTITVELTSDRIIFREHDPRSPVRMPSRDSPAEIRAYLRPSDRSTVPVTAPAPTQVVVSPPPLPPLLPECRHPSHGVERFGQEYPETRSVGDRPGGEHCEIWCAHWQGQLLQSLPPGSEVQPRMPCAHASHRDRPNPWTERIWYSFSCVLDVRTDPIFRLARTTNCQ